MVTDNSSIAPNYLTNKIFGKPDTPWQAKIGQKQCLNCQKELTGRSDKKYCSQKCHDAFNNVRKAEKREEWKKIKNPMEQNDKFLAALYAQDPTRVWSMALLDHPSFHGEAHYSRYKDDRVEHEGKRYIHYSVHQNEIKKTFKILYHG